MPSGNSGHNFVSHVLLSPFKCTGFLIVGAECAQVSPQANADHAARCHGVHGALLLKAARIGLRHQQQHNRRNDHGRNDDDDINVFSFQNQQAASSYFNSQPHSQSLCSMQWGGRRLPASGIFLQIFPR